MDGFFSSDNRHWFFKLLLAHCAIFIFFLFDFINFGMTFSQDIKPFFTLIAIFFWSIYRPTLMLPIYVFALGVLFDIVLGYQIGLHAFLFVGIQWVLRSQRLYFLGQSQTILWLSFALTCFAALVVEWGLFSLFNGYLYEFQAVLFRTVTSIIAFPLVTLLFHIICRTLPPVKQAHFT